tara:strand:- start:363 stop:512 length:150 start_codon:yes stop_codon:yes gene_type:complete
MMEKYATYRIFENIKTGDIKKVLVKDDNLEKIAQYETSDWKELDHDPED